MGYANLRKRGFTLIELMVVVAIIALLASLIVPALQKAQNAALERDCMAKCRGIAASIKTYSISWGGWTSTDPDHYVEIAYPKKPDNPGAIKDFRCQTEASPAATTNDIDEDGAVDGFVSSYTVRGDFVGGNLMSNEELTSQVVVRETNTNHSAFVKGQGEKAVRMGSYGDMRTELLTKVIIAASVARIQYNAGHNGGFGEVEVVDVNDVNVALQKTVSATCGFWGGGWEPANITDGKVTGSPPGAHNQSGHPNIANGCRWDISLDDIPVKDIKEIRIYARADGCCPTQINNQKIQLLNDSDEVLWEAPTMAGPSTGQPHVIAFPDGGTANY